MSLVNLLWTFLIACGYTMWPIIGKYSGISGSLMGMTVVGGTLLTLVVLSSIQIAGTLVPGMRALLFLLGAGVVNGVAVYMHGVKSADSLIPTGIFLMLINIPAVILAPILDLMFNGSLLSLRQCFGILIVIIGIYVVTQ